MKWLTSVRSIITLMLIGVYCILAVKGVMKPEDVQTICAVIVTFYFMKNRNGGGPNDKTNITGSNN